MTPDRLQVFGDYGGSPVVNPFGGGYYLANAVDGYAYVYEENSDGSLTYQVKTPTDARAYNLALAQATDTFAYLTGENGGGAPNRIYQYEFGRYGVLTALTPAYVTLPGSVQSQPVQTSDGSFLIVPGPSVTSWAVSNTGTLTEAGSYLVDPSTGTGAVAITSDDSTVYVWDRTVMYALTLNNDGTFTILNSTNVPNYPSYPSMVMDPSNRFIVMTGASRYVYVYDTELSSVVSTWMSTTGNTLETVVTDGYGNFYVLAGQDRLVYQFTLDASGNLALASTLNTAAQGVAGTGQCVGTGLYLVCLSNDGSNDITTFLLGNDQSLGIPVQCNQQQYPTGQHPAYINTIG